MRYLRRFIYRLARIFARKCILRKKRSLSFMDVQGVFEKEIRSFSGDEYRAGDFKAFSSHDDYNRECRNVFQCSRESIILDYTHKDGHFRV